MQNHLFGGLFLVLLGVLALVAAGRERPQLGEQDEPLKLCCSASALWPQLAGVAGEALLTLAGA